ncbi:MAG: type secretion system protein, partial [Lacunisphaera sp.]|nr:type secretion system protein [Lacunisphaera sp.]
MTTADDYLLQIALERGLLSREQLEEARAKAARHTDLTTGAPRGIEILAADGALDQEALARAVAAEFGMPYVVLATLQIDDEVLAALPRSFVAEHTVMPIARENGVLRVAVADPIAVDVLDSLSLVAGGPIQPELAAVEDIRRAITRYYGKELDELADLANQESPTADLLAELAPIKVAVDQEGQASDRDAPIIRLVQSLLTEAIRRRASDIHLEPLERRFRVRYRIDGVLLEVDAPPKRLQLAIISRLKIMANISIAEKRIPQDGRIQV